MSTPHPRRVLLTAALTGAALAQLPACALAQAFPAREIRLVLPLPPGSSVDAIARSIGPELARVLKQPVIVDNRPGADTMIATQFMKAAQPNGYTLMLVTPAHAINAHLFPKSGIDPVRDFTPIALVASNINVLVTPPSVPARDVRELVALAKARPGQLNFGSFGGTSGASIDLFNLMTGITATEVNYKGPAEAAVDMMGNRLDYMVLAISTALPHVRSGKLRGLAVTGGKRHPSLPDLPAVAEFAPGYEVTAWYGIVGPAGIPAGIVDTVNKGLFEAVHAGEVKTRLAGMGIDAAAASSAADFTAFIQAEIKKWGQVIKPRT